MSSLIVLLTAVAIIYYIGKEVLGAYRHPSTDELTDFWSGEMKRYDRKAYRRTSEHLGSCDKCRDRLDAVRNNNPGPGAGAPMIERKY